MYDVIVIGSGPSGLMASITAGSRNKKVLLIEKNEKIGKKLELTGGGRCNVTNMKSVKDFINQIPVNSKMLYSTLTSFGPTDISNYFETLGVKLKVEDNDRAFPITNSSISIINALYKEIKNYNVELRFNETVKNIELKEEYKEVVTEKETYITKNIIIATGGFSYPTTGSTGDGYRFAKKINQDVTNIYPAETFLKTETSHNLEGITINDVKVYLNDYSESGDILFTHIGLSGPAIFKISEKVYEELLVKKLSVIKIDFLPNIKHEELIDKINNYNPKKEVISFINNFLPKRLSDYLSVNFNKVKMGSLSKTQKQELVDILKQCPFNIIKTGSLEQSLVTGGGVDMKNINSKTMESTIHKGIYFVGEVLDIHGHTGGYNITIALSTGYTAGKSIE